MGKSTLWNKSKNERKKISQQLKKSLHKGTLTSQQIDEAFQRSAQLSCSVKGRYDMEHAGKEAMFKTKAGLSPYICPCCGFIHFGHGSAALNIRKITIEVGK